MKELPMNKLSRFTLSAWALAFAGTMVSAPIAIAADKAESVDALTRYQQERSVCINGESNQDRATCLREAGAALTEARRGGLDEGGSRIQQSRQFEHNALERCAPLPDEDRLACAARIQGMGTVSGSVESGGIYRELVIEEVTLPSGIELRVAPE
jgi:hypothetical protein